MGTVKRGLTVLVISFSSGQFIGRTGIQELRFGITSDLFAIFPPPGWPVKRLVREANDVRGLQTLATTVGKRWIRGVVLYTGTEMIPFGENLHGVPLSAFWSAAN